MVVFSRLHWKVDQKAIAFVASQMSADLPSMANADNCIDIPQRTGQQLVRQDSHRVPKRKQRMIREYRSDRLLLVHIAAFFLPLDHRSSFEVATLHNAF